MQRVLESTDRLVLRRFRDSDAEPLAAYRSDPEVARYQSWSPPVSIDEARRMVGAWAVASEAAPGWFQYAVEVRAEGVLGFTLATAYQGRGYATEAVRCVLTRLFASGLRRVSAECDARNKASAKLLERLGFRREGLRVEHTWIKGEWTDDVLFGLLARDWR